ncbi:MAG: hypothetical protein ACK2UH_15005 [Candidatus Promineifilaceae bacterium]|jgi:hypothetical protein
MANFECPECKRDGLSISLSITLPPDSRSDDIILQIVRCRHCKFRAAAIYEESRRGGLDSESWDHRGYRISQEELARLNRLIKSCRTKRDKHCDCPAHRELSQKNEYGRWLAPFEIDWQRSFPMRRR